MKKSPLDNQRSDHKMPSHVVGIVVRKDHSEALALAGEISQWCNARSLTLLVGVDESRTAAIDGLECLTLAELCNRCSVICSLGGDGTLISTARFSGKSAPIFIGVHFGTLGFLTEITPKEVFAALEAVASSSCVDGACEAENSDNSDNSRLIPLSTRSLFSISIVRNGKTILQTQSLNDVVIQRATQARLIDIDVHAGEQPVMRLRSDGLIVSTPTGSTAYSMAAGGPIVEPSLAAMTLTPICPHSLTSRPLVLGTDCELSITLPSTTGQVFAIIDGVEMIELECGDTVFVSEAPNRARFLRILEFSYFEGLRRKLHWNAPNNGASEK